MRVVEVTGVCFFCFLLLLLFISPASKAVIGAVRHKELNAQACTE